eukprot:270744-Pelagomonas_calceolata.AAC.1
MQRSALQGCFGGEHTELSGQWQCWRRSQLECGAGTGARRMCRCWYGCPDGGNSEIGGAYTWSWPALHARHVRSACVEVASFPLLMDREGGIEWDSFGSQMNNNRSRTQRPAYRLWNKPACCRHTKHNKRSALVHH